MGSEYAHRHGFAPGAPLDDRAPTPGRVPRLSATRYEDWLRRATT
jgi:hypothetical protein